MATAPMPKRGEVWLIDFDPAVGAEIRKARPAIVISVDSVGRLPLRLVVPVTDWKPTYSGLAWFVELPTTPDNGLTNPSGADGFQTKSLSVDRFVRRLGRVTNSPAEQIAETIALCIGLP